MFCKEMTHPIIFGAERKHLAHKSPRLWEGRGQDVCVRSSLLGLHTTFKKKIKLKIFPSQNVLAPFPIEALFGRRCIFLATSPPPPPPKA
jgi:hypothetical protein